MGKLGKITFVVTLIACLASAKPASADFIGTLASILEQAAANNDLPTVDLTGWFLTFDPSDEWTSQSNIETMESWLVIAEEIAANPATLEQFYAWATQFYGPGTTDPLPTATSQWLISNADTQTEAQTSQSGIAAEPATLGLLGAALVIVACCILVRVRRKNYDPVYVSLRRTD